MSQIIKAIDGGAEDCQVGRAIIERYHPHDRFFNRSHDTIRAEYIYWFLVSMSYCHACHWENISQTVNNIWKNHIHIWKWCIIDRNPEYWLNGSIDFSVLHICPWGCLPGSTAFNISVFNSFISDEQCITVIYGLYAAGPRFTNNRYLNF